MIDEIRRQLSLHPLTRPGDAVLVAVSGGADSVALLHILTCLADVLAIRIHAAHLDHALRPESRDEALFVQRLCCELQVPLILQRIAVRETLHPGMGGLEQTARTIRRRFLEDAADHAGCRLIALAHHAGDQAETFLHRMLRGAGPGGLAAMQPQSGRFIRPLLSVTKSAILAYLKQQDVPWVEDVSNQDVSLTRNRIRHELLPLLKTYNPRIEDQLCRLSNRFALEEDFWSEQIVPLAVQEGELRLSLSQIAGLHPALRDRVVRQAMQEVRGDLRGIEEKHVAAVSALLGRSGYKQCHLPGLWIGKTSDALRFRRSAPVVAPGFLVQVSDAGHWVLPDGRSMRFEIDEVSQGQGPLQVEFSAASVAFPLLVRSWRAGDRIRPAGLAGHKKIKKIFIEERILPEERMRIPILTHGEEVLWIAGLRRCAGHLPEPGQGKILRVVLEDVKTKTLGL